MVFGNKIRPDDKSGLENLAKYIIRACFSQERYAVIPHQGIIISYRLASLFAQAEGARRYRDDQHHDHQSAVQGRIQQDLFTTLRKQDFHVKRLHDNALFSLIQKNDWAKPKYQCTNQKKHAD